MSRRLPNPNSLPGTQPPIRITLVATELGVGGAERCLYQLARGLPRPEFAPTVYSLAPPPAAERSELVRGLEEAGIPVHFLNLRRIWHLPGGWSRLRKTWLEDPPDVIQSFLFHADLLAALAKGNRRRPPLVWGIRVADPGRWRHRVRRLLSGRAERVVCVSHAVAQFARDQVQIPVQKLAVIHNGIDAGRFAPEAAESVPNPLSASPASFSSQSPAAGAMSPKQPIGDLHLPTDRPFILCVARLHRQKGLDWLLHALQSVFEQSANHDLLVVGSGPEWPALQRLATQLGIAQRVHFLGWHPAVPQLMRASRLLVLTSRWEGLPNAVLEAMASGIPVIAARTHGVTELLGDDPEQVFQPDDVDGFTRRLLHLLSDPQEAHRLGQKNRARALSQFSLEQMIDAYAQLYRSLVQVSEWPAHRP